MRWHSNLHLLLGLAFVCVAGAHRAALAQDAMPGAIRLHVDSVLATDTHEGMDSKLQATSIGNGLKAIFDYTTYRLIKRDEEQTSFGQAVAFNLPGGRILHIAPMAIEGGMITMELVLFEGAHSIMRTDVKIIRGNAFFLVGPRYPHETYITTIDAETIALPASAEAAAETPAAAASPRPADLPAAAIHQR